MSWLGAAIYDRFTRRSEQACLQDWRASLLAGVRGDIIEVGAGTGANLTHYPPAIERLVLVEPDRYMRRKLSKKLAASGRTNSVDIIDRALEKLDLPDESFDFVVATLVLCSVADLTAALAAIYQLLTPGGGLVFLEHVAAEERPRRLRWQRRLQPVWKRVAGNCHLARHTTSAILAAGFVIEAVTRECMRKAAPVLRPTVRGIARKPA
ncbi:MAG TPA: class I SAM-dependent methyltransferase [Anaerolineales bacterium]|jgi:SAM-dependent methyltransferase|nr:class I SAM-dependent methyltransferase [Anaerolineales bacterium]